MSEQSTTEMEIDTESPPPSETIEESKMHVVDDHHNNDANLEDDEDVEDLLDLMDDANAVSKNDASNATVIPTLKRVTESEKSGPKAVQIRERAVYDVTRAFCVRKQYQDVVAFLETSSFFATVNKAKCAKVVRRILDIVCEIAPEEGDTQREICEKIVAWCKREKRTFLRQRVEAKLASIFFTQNSYAEALTLIDSLLKELKKIDDKQLLVEIHLMESKTHFALRNVPKAKSALTASRTAANAIYVAPNLQASIDVMSGTVQTEEGDYNTAHSYFLEAFEQLDQMNSTNEAIKSLKYMMLCKILDNLTKTLQLSAKGVVGIDKITSARSSSLEIGNLVTSKQAVKYAGRDLEAMTSIAKAASERSLNEYERVLTDYKTELQSDLLVAHHLHILRERLMESNLIRIVEPYSRVEIDHVASLMEMSALDVEKKLSQMILDGKFKGILDQGEGHLIIYEEGEKDKAMEKGLEVLDRMDEVVTTLFERSKSLRTLAI